MKAVSVQQPFASLIAIGAKRIETSSSPPPIALVGERVAIYAARSHDHLYRVRDQRVGRALEQARADERLVLVDGELPFGCVVATAVLVRGERVSAECAARLRERERDEYAFGSYRVGRYAWVLRDVEQLPVPVRVRGSQRIFTIADELLTPAQGTLL